MKFTITNQGFTTFDLELSPAEAVRLAASIASAAADAMTARTPRTAGVAVSVLQTSDQAFPGFLNFTVAQPAPVTPA